MYDKPGKSKNYQCDYVEKILHHAIRAFTRIIGTKIRLILIN